jgi:primase-polymerase (primpol)-like protein
MTCEVCGANFAARADARFCSGRCRVAAHRRPGLPADLISRPRWVRHRAKVPMTLAGRHASTTDPTTWASYADAAGSDVGDGLGFVFNGDGIAGIDLDHCLTDGVLDSWAQAILDRCPRTYVEVSPSGTGLHIFGRAHVGAGRRSGGVEVYDRGRYFTVTGRHFGKPSRKLADITGLIASL